MVRLLLVGRDTGKFPDVQASLRQGTWKIGPEDLSAFIYRDQASCLGSISGQKASTRTGVEAGVRNITKHRPHITSSGIFSSTLSIVFHVFPHWTASIEADLELVWH